MSIATLREADHLGRTSYCFYTVAYNRINYGANALRAAIVDNWREPSGEFLLWGNISISSGNPFLASRITSDLVSRSLNEARKQFPDRSCWDLTDNHDLTAVSLLRVDSSVDIEKSLFSEADYFLLAFEQDDTCSRVMARLNALGKPYFVPCEKP